MIVAELDEDLVAAPDRLAPDGSTTAEVRSLSETEAAESSGRGTSKSSSGESKSSSGESSTPAKRTRPEQEGDGPAESSSQERPRPFADLPELPDDVAEAFEQFKLVILAHKLAGWQEIGRDDMLATLDALKELAQLPADA